jgi:lipoprotein-anchoring transpeptidase ErfK/SrfK
LVVGLLACQRPDDHLSAEPMASSSPPPSASIERSVQPSPSLSPIGLRPGDGGPSVLLLQQRLTELGFWLGTPDGVYAALTAHAVTAFQKANGLPRDGIAGERTLATLDSAVRPIPRSTDGANRLEVDLRRQLLLIVTKGQVRWVMDTSTGKVAGTTPAGHHRVYRQVDGYHRAPLGVLYRPKYIFEGVAVHGFPQVPSYPASHGCIRVTYASMDWLWSNDAMPIGTDVWIY